MIKIKQTRLGKNSDRYTSKVLAKNSCTIMTTAGVDFTATFMTDVVRNDDEIKTLRVELSERTLRKALADIERHKKHNQDAQALRSK